MARMIGYANPVAQWAGRSRLLPAISGWTIVLYVAGSPFYLGLNLTAGDLWMLVALAAVIVSDRAAAGVLALVTGAYGLVAAALSACLLAAGLNADDPLGSVSFVSQMLFTIWLVVPMVAGGLAEHRDPYRFLRHAGVAYLLFYAVGMVLLFGFGSDAILIQTGIGRVFQRFTTQVLQLSLMALGAAGLVFGTERRPTYLALLLGSAVPVLLNASRTGLVSFGLLGLMAVFGTVRSLRGLLTVFASGALVVTAGYALLNSTVAQELWQIRVLSASGLLDDEARLRSIATSLSAIRESVPTLFFGSGWGSSGGEMVVHNFVIQVIHEGGLLVLLPLLALFGLPLAWAASLRDGDPMRRPFVFMLMGAVLLFWSLNALVVERSYWMAYAVALGVAYRPRVGLRLDPSRSS
jgi:hypothetical protein